MKNSISMNDPSLKRTSRCWRVSWCVFVAFALGVWPAASHWSWLNLRKALHGVPAFFLGLLALVLLGSLIRLVLGVIRHGWNRLLCVELCRGIGVALVLAISLVILFYNVELWRGKQAWARLVHDSNRQGLSLDPLSTAPPAATQDQDLGQLPMFSCLRTNLTAGRDASGIRTKPELGILKDVAGYSGVNRYQDRLELAPWMEGQLTDFGLWLAALDPKNDAGTETQKRNPIIMAREIVDKTASFDGLIAELRNHSDRPYFRLPFDYEHSFLAENHAERILLGFMRILRLRASAELSLNLEQAACQDLRLAIRLASYLQQIPCLYYHRNRAYGFADVLQPLWEGLSSRVWTVQQLETLQRDLSQFTPLSDYAGIVRYVAFSNAGFIEDIIPTVRSQPVNCSVLGPDEQQTIRWLRRFYPVGWSLMNQATIYQLWLDRHQSLSQSPTGYPWLPAFPGSIIKRVLRGSSDPFFPVFMVPRYVQMLANIDEALPFSETVARLAMLACALERHRITAGFYPEHIESLAPAFIRALPCDPVNGGPLRYFCENPQCYRLYSVGLNRIDDQGDPSPRVLNWKGELESEYELSRGDWVWQPGNPKIANP